MSRRVKRLKETTRERVLKWIKNCSDVNFGIWIECVECKKWRKSYKYSESHEVEENWCCSMNTLEEGRKGSCDDPEEGILEEEYLEYSPGSIVWGKLDGYPWWPAMVDVDPDIEEYFWTTKNTMFYHVTFLDDHVTRSWVSSKCLSPFSRRPLNSKFQKKYFAAITKAKERANIAAQMPLKERLKMYSFVHLYKGKWPLACDFDEDEDEAHNLTNILLEEVDDLDSLNSFDSGIKNSPPENNSPPETENRKKEPNLSPCTKSQMKKNSNAVSSKSGNAHNGAKNYKNCSNGIGQGQKLQGSKENPSNSIKLKSKLSLAKKDLQRKCQLSNFIEDFITLPKETSDDESEDTVQSSKINVVPSSCDPFKKVKANKKIDVLENQKSECKESDSSSDVEGMVGKSQNTSDLELNKNSKFDCLEKSSEESMNSMVEIPNLQDSKTGISDEKITSDASKGNSELEITDNLGKSIEWVVHNFKVTEENLMVEKSKNGSNEKLKVKMLTKNKKNLNNSFEDVFQGGNKDISVKSIKKRKEGKDDMTNEAKRLHKDSDSEKIKVKPFKPVVPKDVKNGESNIPESTSKMKHQNEKKSKAANFSPKKVPTPCKVVKRKESENLSSSNESSGNKKLKPSFQVKVKSKPTSQEKLKKGKFKVPLPDAPKVLNEEKKIVAESSKIYTDSENSDIDSDSLEFSVKKAIDQVNGDLKKDSLNGNASGSDNANDVDVVKKDNNILSAGLFGKLHAKKENGVFKAPLLDSTKNDCKTKNLDKNETDLKSEHSEENTDIFPKVEENNVNNKEDDKIQSKCKRSLNNLDTPRSDDVNDLDVDKKDVFHFVASSGKPKHPRKNEIEMHCNGNVTGENSNPSDISLPKKEANSYDDDENITNMSDSENKSKTNGIVSTETNEMDDYFLDIGLSDDDC